MSDHGYDGDFENYSDEGFESDNELEVPQQQLEAKEQLPLQQHAVAVAGVAADAWPSLAAGQSAWRGSQQRSNAATFSRSLFGGPASRPASQQHGESASGTFTVSPAAPPLTDSQRTCASKALARSLQLQQQQKLSFSPQLELLMVQPLSAYQQFAQGVGAFAHTRIGICQTGQLDQDLHEQDAQTEEVDVASSSCQVPDDAYAPGSNASPFGGTSSSAGSAGDSKLFNNSTAAAAAAAAASAKSAAAARLLDDTAMVDFLEWALPEVMFELGKAAAAADAAAEGKRAAAARQGLQFAPCKVQMHPAGSCSNGPSLLHNHSCNSSSSSRSSPMLTGELQLGDTASHSKLLAGRSVVAVACPPTPADAVAAAAAISAAAAAAAAGVSSHLLLSCCSPVAMSAEAAIKEHGIAGWGCLCVWDLKAQQQRQQQQQVAAANAGLVQLLVSEGRPSCCCWGTGAGSCLVFAGMEEGGLCCWDLSEPDKLHQPQQQQQPQHSKDKLQQQQQQQQQQLPARRPSYSTELPLTSSSSDTSWLTPEPPARAGFSSSSSTNNPGSTGTTSCTAFTLGLGSTDSIVAIAILQPAALNRAAGSSAAFWGGAVCQLVSLSAAGSVAMFSVMLGAAAGRLAAESGVAAAAADLGTRAGSRVWLVKTLEALPLGPIAAKPLHLRNTHTFARASSSSSMLASALALLPGPNQQLLVGLSMGRVVKGACLGTPAPPREYVAAQWQQLNSWGKSTGAAISTSTAADTDNTADTDGRSGSYGGCSSSAGVQGSVLSIAVCPAFPEALLAGYSCGSVAMFSVAKSRPVLLWQQLSSAAVVAVRWMPMQPSMCLVLFTDGCLLVLDLQQTTKHAIASTNLARPAAAGAAVLPCCMEVACASSSSTSQLSAISSSSSNGGNRGMRLRASSSNKAVQGSSSAAAHAGCVACVGYSDGSAVLYELSVGTGAAGTDAAAVADAMQALQQLLAGC